MFADSTRPQARSRPSAGRTSNVAVMRPAGDGPPATRPSSGLAERGPVECSGADLAPAIRLVPPPDQIRRALEHRSLPRDDQGRRRHHRIHDCRRRELRGPTTATEHGVPFWYVPPAGFEAHLCRHDRHRCAHNSRSRGLSFSPGRLGLRGDNANGRASGAAVGSGPGLTGASSRNLSLFSPFVEAGAARSLAAPTGACSRSRSLIGITREQRPSRVIHGGSFLSMARRVG